MITCNCNVINYIVEMPVIMNTFQLLYKYSGKKKYLPLVNGRYL